MLRSSIDIPRTFTRALCCLPRLARILDERPPAMMSAAVIAGGVMLESAGNPGGGLFRTLLILIEPGLLPDRRTKRTNESALRSLLIEEAECSLQHR
jgi:hypothetical protein